MSAALKHPWLVEWLISLLRDSSRAEDDAGGDAYGRSSSTPRTAMLFDVASSGRCSLSDGHAFVRAQLTPECAASLVSEFGDGTTVPKLSDSLVLVTSLSARVDGSLLPNVRGAWRDAIQGADDVASAITPHLVVRAARLLQDKLELQTRPVHVTDVPAFRAAWTDLTPGEVLRRLRPAPASTSAGRKPPALTWSLDAMVSEARRAPSGAREREAPRTQAPRSQVPPPADDDGSVTDADEEDARPRNPLGGAAARASSSSEQERGSEKRARLSPAKPRARDAEPPTRASPTTAKRGDEEVGGDEEERRRKALRARVTFLETYGSLDAESSASDEEDARQRAGPGAAASLRSAASAAPRSPLVSSPARQPRAAPPPAASSSSAASSSAYLHPPGAVAVPRTSTSNALLDFLTGGDADDGGGEAVPTAPRPAARLAASSPSRAHPSGEAAPQPPRAHGESRGNGLPSTPYSVSLGPGQSGLTVDGQLRVSHVLPGSQASRMGVRAGDRVVRVNEVAGHADMMRLLGDARAQPIRVQFERVASPQKAPRQETESLVGRTFSFAFGGLVYPMVVVSEQRAQGQVQARLADDPPEAAATRTFRREEVVKWLAASDAQPRVEPSRVFPSPEVFGFASGEEVDAGELGAVVYAARFMRW